MHTIRPHSRSKIRAVLPSGRKAEAPPAAPSVVAHQGVAYGWSSEFQAAFERVTSSGTPCAG
jgi:hypothetical protein